MGSVWKPKNFITVVGIVVWLSILSVPAAGTLMLS